MTDEIEKEATTAPIDHIKISSAIQEAILEKFYQAKAFSEKTALLEEELSLSEAEKQSFTYLVFRGTILETEKNGLRYYFLCEEVKPPKNYRKEVVMGLSIPLLFFLLSLLAAGLGAIIFSLISFLR
ncbi:MAG: hypothetical protein K9W42_11240 [Candidatus Heimdallarchaeota archaeon]|nr:hypothetical protein [Candidatus Heimdallarchaeota archaeon]